MTSRFSVSLAPESVTYLIRHSISFKAYFELAGKFGRFEFVDGHKRFVEEGLWSYFDRNWFRLGLVIKGICNPSLTTIHIDVFVYKACPSQICLAVFHWLVNLLFRNKVTHSYRRIHFRFVEAYVCIMLRPMQKMHPLLWGKEAYLNRQVDVRMISFTISSWKTEENMVWTLGVAYPFKENEHCWKLQIY